VENKEFSSGRISFQGMRSVDSYVKEVGISSNLEKRRDKARWSKPPEGVGKLNVDACLYAWKRLLTSVTTEP
jgi:hypothetical protein